MTDMVRHIRRPVALDVALGADHAAAGNDWAAIPESSGAVNA
jgi:hypothetical protein